MTEDELKPEAYKENVEETRKRGTYLSPTSSGFSRPHYSSTGMSIFVNCICMSTASLLLTELFVIVICIHSKYEYVSLKKKRKQKLDIVDIVNRKYFFGVYLKYKGLHMVIQTEADITDHACDTLFRFE